MKMKSKNYMRLVILLSVCMSKLIAQPPRGPVVVSPKVNADKSVTFSYLAPQANEVKLSAQFEKAPVAMIKGDQGIWSITIGPVKPDIYPYSFHVDGITVMDPANVAFFPNERFKASLVEIPDDNPTFYSLQNVPHGTITYEYYPSVDGSQGTIVVYTPPGYAKDQAKKYPVYYLISGTTDTEETFFKVGKTHLIMDNLIAANKAKPMIIVMPYGNPFARIAEQKGMTKPGDVVNRDSDEAIKRAKLFETDLVSHVIPYVESNYRTIPQKDSRAIGGFSRGGGQTLRTAFNHVDKFSWVCSYASFITPAEMDQRFSQITSDPLKTNKNFKLLWSGIGTDDFLYKGTVEFNEYLAGKKIDLKTFTTDGGHTWMNVKKYLIETLPLLFK